MPAHGPAIASSVLRAEQRFETRLPAIVSDGAAPFSALLLDLSRGGALVEAAARPAAGSEVRLRLDRFDLAAVVVWAERSRFGLRFAEPLRATELLVLLSRGREARAAGSSLRPAHTAIPCS